MLRNRTNAPWILQAPAQIRDARIEISYSLANFCISTSVADCSKKRRKLKKLGGKAGKD